MTRQEIHLDAMLRHLGAAYYDSLHGRAAGGEVRRALARVDRQLGDESAEQRPGPPDSGRPVHEHHGKLHCRVRDVMATNVITIDLAMPFSAVYIDLSGLSGYRGLLDLIALLSTYAALLEPRVIVVKSGALKHFALCCQAWSRPSGTFVGCCPSQP